MTRFALLFSLIVATCSWSVDVYAYPGSAVSTGTNPVRSASGTYTLDAPGPTIISAPPDQDLVLTDIFMGCAVR